MKIILISIIIILLIICMGMFFLLRGFGKGADKLLKEFWNKF